MILQPRAFHSSIHAIQLERGWQKNLQQQEVATEKEDITKFLDVKKSVFSIVIQMKTPIACLCHVK